MATTPPISIIIPTFNSATTLKVAIDSVLAQQFRDFELIIIDGRSTDNTIEVATSFDDGRITIYSEHDTGVYDGMNKGIYIAKGEWLYFLGSDDYFINTYVLGNIYALLSKHNPDFLYGRVIYGDNNLVYGKEFKIKDLYFQNICHQAIFIKKHVVIKHGMFNINLPHCADWDMNLKIFRDKNLHIQYTNQVIAFYSLQGMSSQSPVIDEFFHYRQVLKRKYFTFKNRILLYLSKLFYRLGELLIPSR